MLYGCENYAHVEETINRVREEKDSVSKSLKEISGDIRRHEKEYGFSLPNDFVPKPDYFTIILLHISFRDRALNSVRSGNEKGS